jgi:methyl coenzyme M reductase subunit C
MAETIPLNKFRLLTAELQSGNNLIYSSSLDVATILLSTQITNITSSYQTVSVSIQKSGSMSHIMLLNSGSVPPDESLNPLAGKIVLEKHDSLIMNTDNTGKLHIVLSVLENAIN